MYPPVHVLDGMRQATDVFVGSLGGERVGEPKTFHPIQDFTGKSPEQISADIQGWFSKPDRLSDCNACFQVVAVHVKRQNLVLAPLNIVMFSDGMPDIPGASRMSADQLYGKIDLGPLEFLSRSVSVRLLYASPTIAQNWERRAKRTRVRLWTQDSTEMQGWRRFQAPGLPPERQRAVVSWTHKILDFRVRRTKIL